MTEVGFSAQLSFRQRRRKEPMVRSSSRRFCVLSLSLSSYGVRSPVFRRLVALVSAVVFHSFTVTGSSSAEERVGPVVKRNVALRAGDAGSFAAGGVFRGDAVDEVVELGVDPAVFFEEGHL